MRIAEDGKAGGLQPRDLRRVKRFSTMSMRPTPCFRAKVFAVKVLVGSVATCWDLEVSLTGRLFSKSMAISSGSLGAERIRFALSFHMSLGRVVSGSSKMPASCCSGQGFQKKK